MATNKNIKKLEVGEKCEEHKPLRFRNFIVLLYEDAENYDFKETLRICKSQKKWAYIKHFPESNEKKEHFHVILRFENNKTKEALAKELGIPDNYIDPVKNFRTICRYLIHKDDEDKYQYSLDQVQVSEAFEREYKKQFDDIESEDTIIDNIYKFIDSIVNDNPFTECLRLLVLYVNGHCYDTVYKRYRFEFQDYLKMTCKM